jgi:recombinational DNA repair protein (RecF pathway)
MYGITTRIISYLETDLLVTLYTEFGLKTVRLQRFNKFIKANEVQILCLANFEVENSKFNNVIFFDIEDHFYDIKGDSYKFKEAHVFIELINKLESQFNDKEMFKLLLDSIRQLNNKSTLLSFLIRVLYITGIGPDLTIPLEEIKGISHTGFIIKDASLVTAIDLNEEESIDFYNYLANEDYKNTKNKVKLLLYIYNYIDTHLYVKLGTIMILARE